MTNADETHPVSPAGTDLAGTGAGAYNKCQKRAYAGQLAAFEALADARSKGRPEKRAYRCRRCRCWHLTRSPLRMTTGSGPWPDAPAGLA